VQAHLDVALSVRSSKAGIESKCKRYDRSKSERATIDLNAANLPKKNYKHKRKSVTKKFFGEVFFVGRFLSERFCFHIDTVE
jgi:hypothetical protein